MKSEERPALFLVDASHHLYRAYFAIRRLTNSKGFSTNAIYGFVTMLNRLLEAHRPSYLACCFDRAEKTFRHEMFEDYKAGRDEMPDDLVPQIPYVKHVCEARRIPVLEREGFEADDIMGTLAVRAAADGYDVVLVTNDKDLFQLVRSNVRVLYIDRQEGERFLDEAGVEEMFGVRPAQVVDVLALWGDPTDNIPGVPGIGEKGAKQIIHRCGSLEEAIRQSDVLAEKRYRGKITEHVDEARLSKTLATVRTDVDVPWSPEKLRVREPDVETLRALYEELEFQKFLEKLPQQTGGVPAPAAASGKETVPIAADEPPRTLDAKALGALLKDAEARGQIGISPHPAAGGATASPRELIFAVDDGAAYSLALDEAESAECAAAFLENPDVLKTTHDVKRLLLFFPSLSPPFADTMLAAYVLDPEEGAYDVETLARRRLGREIAMPKRPSRRGLYEEAEEDNSGTALCARALVPLWEELKKGLAQQPLLESLYETLELPLTRVLAAMERHGVLLDAERLGELGRELGGELQTLGAEIFDMAGEEFNLNSPRQLAKILYEKLSLPVLKKTAKTKAASTGTEVLELLVAEHPIAQKILDYRQKTKLKSTYVDALPRLAHPQTGRVHTSYNQCVAATGRLSSSEPNLQNIPIRTAEGRRIREAFVAPEGWRLVSADYSQIELRILAHLSGDAVLAKAFERGEDVHERTAVEILGAQPGEVAPDLRRRAKTVNFGVIYGMSAYGLAKQVGVEMGEAASMIRAYFERYAGVAELREEVLKAARETGVVHTLFGRVRRIPEIRNRNRVVREAAERAAFNTPIQGSAADLMKRAMLKVFEAFEARDDAHLIMQVHDELVLEARENAAEGVAQEVKELMEEAFALNVPLAVDTKISRSWM
ncbi:MAG: DNA polymerase I [Acidobacteriota bacterium]|nr:MAG: DNA polymerase I [Acidobacteriota bacterium]